MFVSTTSPSSEKNGEIDECEKIVYSSLCALCCGNVFLFVFSMTSMNWSTEAFKWIIGTSVFAFFLLCVCFMSCFISFSERRDKYLSIYGEEVSRRTREVDLPEIPGQDISVHITNSEGNL